MNNFQSKEIFERESVEFVTVAAEYCNFLENSAGIERSKFTDTMLKILPLLYVKAILLPEHLETISDDELETFVTEDIYTQMQSHIASILEDSDFYLDLSIENMKIDDRPVACHISEDLSDIYQDIKNFIHVFKLGINETMNDSLAKCKENFRLYWGQKLLNALRALHDVNFEQDNE